MTALLERVHHVHDATRVLRKDAQTRKLAVRLSARDSDICAHIDFGQVTDSSYLLLVSLKTCEPSSQTLHMPHDLPVAGEYFLCSSFVSLVMEAHATTFACHSRIKMVEWLGGCRSRVAGSEPVSCPATLSTDSQSYHSHPPSVPVR